MFQNVHPTWLTAALAIVKSAGIYGGDLYQSKNDRDKNYGKEERLSVKLDPVESFTRDHLFYEISAMVGKEVGLLDLKHD